MSTLNEQIGKRVAKAREAKGWTQQELAERVGVKQPTISMLEAGHRAPSVGTLAALEKHLKIDLLGRKP